MPQQPAIGDDVTALMNGTAPDVGADVSALMAASSDAASDVGVLSALSKASGIGGYPVLSTEERRRRERNRPDNAIMGLPPELIVPGVLGVGGAVAKAGVGAAQKAIAGGKALIGQAMPVVKYEAVESALEGVGVPRGIATSIALLVGMSPTTAIGRAGKAIRSRTPRSTPSSAPASSASPAVSPPAVPAPPAAPSASQSASGLLAGSTPSPQMLRNQVGLEARRAGLTLNEAQLSAADALVAKGASPADAVRVAAGSTGQAAPAAVPSVAKVKLTAAESKEYARLLDDGKSHQEAIQSIELQRGLAKMFGLPSSETVRATVAERNATGRWPKP